MTETMATFVRSVMLAIAALLPIINPPGVAPIFLSLTRGARDAERTTMAGRIARNSFVLLLTAVLVGSYVLAFFGLSLAVVKIAGGLLVISAGWNLIRADTPPDSAIVSTAPPSNDGESQTFYPLTFPLTIGPGAISVTIALGAGATGTNDLADAALVLATVVGIALVSCTVYLSYRFAARLARGLGATGMVVLLRLSAFILMAIGVEILCDGLVERFGVGST